MANRVNSLIVAHSIPGTIPNLYYIIFYKKVGLTKDSQEMDDVVVWTYEADCGSDGMEVVEHLIM